MIYLDNAATTPMCESAIEAMDSCLKENYGNPSSIHAAGRKAKAKLEQARKEIASFIHASPGEIYFTSGGTESNNTAIKRAVQDLGVDTIITSPIEHHSVMHSIDTLKESGAVNVVYLDIDKTGKISIEQLEKTLQQNKDKTILVSIIHSNNEIGTVNDLTSIGSVCRNHKAYFHSDTVQSIAHLPINVAEDYISFLSASAHKFHGPKGVGFMYIHNEIDLRPFMDGGGQEREMRAGTENLAGIVGMQVAMRDIYHNFDIYRQEVTKIRNCFKEKLLMAFPDVEFNGCQENFLQTVLSVSFPPHPKNEMLILNLDLKGICASGGSACSSGAENISHVILALQGEESDRGTVRFSFSHFTTKEEVDATIKALTEILT